MEASLIYRIEQDFKASDKTSNNFLKGVKWSPDGMCLLSNSEDNILRLFEPAETPPSGPVLQFVPGDTVFDFEWYPLMRSSDPSTCCLLSTSRGHPIHLWDAFTGALRASYRGFDHLDEPVTALSVGCTSEQIIAGYDEEIRIFDIAQPGRTCSYIKTLSSTRQGKRKLVEGQRGLISAIAVCPDDPSLFAAGSYMGDIYLYSLKDNEMVAPMEGKSGGVSQLKFSPNGQYLFSGARKSGEILCWDVRNTGQILGKFARDASTCQRIYFDIDPLSGRFLVTGSRDGSVRCYDLTSSPDESSTFLPCFSFQANHDSTNGVSFHPFFGGEFPLLATTSGERLFSVTCEDSSDDEEEPQPQGSNGIGLWKLLLSLPQREPPEVPSVCSESVLPESAPPNSPSDPPLL